MKGVLTVTKRFLWVLCLMLALTLVAGAYAEGGNEGPVPELRAMEDVIIPSHLLLIC